MKICRYEPRRVMPVFPRAGRAWKENIQVMHRMKDPALVRTLKTNNPKFPCRYCVLNGALSWVLSRVEIFIPFPVVRFLARSLDVKSVRRQGRRTVPKSENWMETRAVQVEGERWEPMWSGLGKAQVG